MFKVTCSYQSSLALVCVDRATCMCKASNIRVSVCSIYGTLSLEFGTRPIGFQALPNSLSNPFRLFINSITNIFEHVAHAD